MAEAALAQRPAASGTTVLNVKGLQAWYDESHILHGVDLDVREGEVVTLLGRNGAGKTTTLKAIMGIVAQAHGFGRVRRQGAHRPLDRPHRPARRRVLPGGARHIRISLGQGEPVAAAPIAKAGGMSWSEIFALFPNLRERLIERRRQALRRRAADARDRPHPAHRRAISDAGRADRGPRAGHHPADRPHHRRAQAGGIHDSAGRAEFPLRLDPGRSVFRHGARPHHRRVRQLGTGGQDGWLHEALGV